MTLSIDAPWASAMGHEPLNRLVSEIFSMKVADRQTDRQTDNKPVGGLTCAGAKL